MRNACSPPMPSAVIVSPARADKLLGDAGRSSGGRSAIRVASVVLERAGEVLGLLRVPVHLLHRRTVTFHGCGSATGRPEGPARKLP